MTPPGLTNLVPGRGLVVRYADCDVTREVTDSAYSRVQGYGISSGDWRATDLVEQGQGARFRVQRCGEPFCDVALAMSGEHNVLNALAAVAAANEHGLTPQEIADSLATFQGVRRRLECRGTADDVTVLDDFAHHPTAIHATLCAVRRRYPAARIWAVLEPRSWSLRRNVFQERLVGALGPADEIVVAGVYRAQEIPDSERLDPRRLAADLQARGHRARFLPDVQKILAELGDSARPGDVITIMSNGAFGGLHDRLLRSLRSRTEAARER